MKNHNNNNNRLKKVSVQKDIDKNNNQNQQHYKMESWKFKSQKLNKSPLCEINHFKES